MNHRVLIVDDSPILRAVIRKAVQSLGIVQIEEASNGAEAMQIIEQTPIDLILLDLNMPVMSGDEFAAQLRAGDTGAETPIVVVSTEVNEARLSAMRDLGARWRLSKPFEPEELRTIINDALEAAI